MIRSIKPFPVDEIASPALFIVIVGFLISFWVTRKPLLSLFLAFVKALIFFVYFTAYFDGTYTALDDWAYLEAGRHHLRDGVSVINFFEDIRKLSGVANGWHFVYDLYNADSFRLFGDSYYAPVACNVVLTFFTATFIVATAWKVFGFTHRISLALYIFIVLHPNVVAWSSIFNLKDTLVMTGTALFVYIVSLVETRSYFRAILFFAGVSLILLFTRFYVPLLVIAAFVGASLSLLGNLRSKKSLRLCILSVCLMVVLFTLESADISDAYMRFLLGFVNPLYGVPRVILTPIPFSASPSYAFLNFPQVFHYLLIPALVYGIIRFWLRATLTSRFIVIYFLIMILMLGMFDNLQGPRHRVQLDGITALFQFYGGIGLLKKAFSHSFFRNASKPTNRMKEAYTC